MMKKVSFSVAVLLYGASAVKLRRGDRQPPPVPKESVECIIDGAAEHGEEIGGKEAVDWSHYCFCEEVDAEE